MSKSRRVTSFLVLAMTGGVIFQVAYLRFVFLADTAHALGLTIQQYGGITSVFGAVAVVGYFCGGWFADRFSPRLLIVIALVGTGVVDLYLATVPGAAGVLVAHILFAVLGTGLYWSALIKSIGLLGTASEQGRLFGFLEGTRGLTSTIVGLVGSALVASAIVAADGVLTLIRVYGVLCLVFAILVVIVVRQDRGALDAAARQAVSLRELAAAARNRYTWLIGGTIMTMYCFYTLLGYLTPLLQNGFGVAATFIGIIGVVRTYVFQFVAGPLGGYLVDRVARSAPRFLRWTFVVAGLCAAGYLVLPQRPSLLWVAIALMLVLSLAVFTARGVYWATVGEVEIPTAQRGGVIGLASGIAYLPDAFLPAIAAWWIGDPSAGIPEQGGGYSTLFAVLIAASIAGWLLTTLTLRTRAGDLARGHATGAADSTAPPLADTVPTD
jgi:MFS family permease